MANNIVVLDFFGLPGCGKSVCAHELAKILLHNGLNVDEPTYCMDHHNSILIRFILKTIYSLMFMLKYPKRAQMINGLLKSHTTAKYSNIASQRRNLFYKLYLTLSKQKHFVIMDEGIAQAAISITTGTEYSSKHLYQSILYCLPQNINYYPVYLKIDIKTSISNMDSRQSNDSRAEKIKDSRSKIAFLKLFESKVKCLSEVSKISIKNDGSIMPSKIAKMIYSQLVSNSITRTTMKL